MLEPGTVVLIKPANEIIKTLDKDNARRGVRFEDDMFSYCSKLCTIKERLHNGTYKLIESNQCLWINEWFNIVSNCFNKEILNDNSK